MLQLAGVHGVHLALFKGGRHLGRPEVQVSDIARLAPW